jgi:zinc/manganese transport system ATP-binding protein
MTAARPARPPGSPATPAPGFPASPVPGPSAAPVAGPPGPPVTGAQSPQPAATLMPGAQPADPQPAGGPVIQASGLASGYGGRIVWSGADFEVGTGEFLTVLGPNGAGKSTLLRMLLGLLPPAGGTLRVFGAPPQRGNPGIGYVPQRRALDPDLSVSAEDIVGLGVDGHRWGVRLSRRRGSQRREAVAEALAAVGAADYARRAAGRLSGGEQQRLQLAQALVDQPQLLLLDEPLASLDLRSQQAVSQLVADLQAQQGFAVVLVTHDINPVLSVTDRVMYIAGGSVSVGPPGEVITSENLSRLYQAEVEVIRDSRGRLFVVGLEAETAHPHSPSSPTGVPS